MTLYFAYGSNMDRSLMRLRCPAAYAIGTGRLDDWRWLTTIDGYASIARRRGARVHGVVWRLTPRDLAALDAYEAVASGLYRRAPMPVVCDGKRIAAQVYLGRSTAPGRPRPGFLPLMVAAARAWNLPAGYCAELQRWAGSGWQGARRPDVGEVR